MSQIRQLLSDSVIYGIGYIGARLVTFFLVPYHTDIFPREMYGVFGLSMVFIGIVQIIFRFGSDFSLIRHYELAESQDEKRLVFSSTFWPLILTSSILGTTILLSRSPLSFVLFGTEDYAHLFYFLVPIIFIDTFVILSKTLLRLQQRPIYFSTVNLVNVCITFGLNIYFISGLGMGIEGAFLANIVASAVMFLSMLPAILGELRLQFSFMQYRKILLFGLPLIASGLASMVMELINRPILQWLTDLETVGLYNAGAKLGIFMMLVTTAFNFAWQPFFMKAGQTEEGPTIFARVLTYFVFILSGMFIVLTLFIQQIATMPIPFTGILLLGKDYHAAIPMIPIIFAAYIFYGIYLNFLPGVYLKDQSGKLAKFTIIGAVVNVAGNFTFIPLIGFYGAALATLVAYLTMAVLLYFTQMKLYPTPYRWKKVFTTLGITAFLTGSFYWLDPAFPGKLLIIILFIVLHFALGFLKISEFMQIIKSVIGRQRS